MNSFDHRGKPIASKVRQIHKQALRAQACRVKAEDGRSRKASVQGRRVDAFGSTFILAPSFSMRMNAEDYLLLKLFTAHCGLAYCSHSEVQASARLAELVAVEARQGVGSADALCACDLLGPDANRVLSSANAGGTSRVSEAMSAEVLSRAFGARLLATELEIAYWPTHGSITDFSIDLDGTILGVSVTRAIGPPSAEYTVEAAALLLSKKLGGILRSTESACGAWAKQILHVWVPTAATAATINKAYAALPLALVADTVVLVSVCDGLHALFHEKASAPTKPEVRVAKGLKDEAHLRVLAQSDPLRHNICAR